MNQKQQIIFEMICHDSKTVTHKITVIFFLSTDMHAECTVAMKREESSTRVVFLHSKALFT
jgi:hypothetical protein